jgi:hypothetical protein
MERRPVRSGLRRQPASLISPGSCSTSHGGIGRIGMLLCGEENLRVLANPRPGSPRKSPSDRSARRRACTAAFRAAKNYASYNISIGRKSKNRFDIGIRQARPIAAHSPRVY